MLAGNDPVVKTLAVPVAAGCDVFVRKMARPRLFRFRTQKFVQEKRRDHKEENRADDIAVFDAAGKAKAEKENERLQAPRPEFRPVFRSGIFVFGHHSPSPRLFCRVRAGLAMTESAAIRNRRYLE